MSATEERALAAVALRRLAREMRGLAAIGPEWIVAIERDRARKAVAETRREAVATLRRLRDALPDGWIQRRAVTQGRMLADPKQSVGDDWPLGLTSGAIDAWATAWEAP